MQRCAINIMKKSLKINLFGIKASFNTITLLVGLFLGMIGFFGLYVVLFIIGLKCYRMNFFDDDILMAYVVVMAIMVFGDMFMANSYKRILWLPALMMIVNYDRVKDRVK